MIKQLAEYVRQRGNSVSLRIFKSSKPRFNNLQKRLTVNNNGTPFSQAQVMEYLLDIEEYHGNLQNN